MALGWWMLAVTGCCLPLSSSESTDSPAHSSSSSPPAPEASGMIVSEDLLASVARCDVYHRGAVIDMGSSLSHGRFDYSFDQPASVQDVQRDGATWGRIKGGVVSLRFEQLEDEPVFVETRIRGLDARAATVRIDGKAVGTLRFAREETQVVSTATSSEPLSAGQHLVSFQFHRSRKDKPVVEMDWIRIGLPDQDPTTYAAPTLRDLATDTMVGERPYRALALRAPGRVRCAIAATDTMRLQAMLGYAGAGEGEARIEIVEPGKPSVLLHAAKVGGEGHRTEGLDIPLEGLAGRIVALDLVAASTAPGGKVLFGEPMLRIRDPRIADRPDTKVVVLVVFTGANRTHLPGYATVETMPALSSVVEESVVFHQHRAPSTVAAGSMASLLTGYSPAVHKVTDSATRMPDRVSMLSAMGRDRRVATAMFTANPSTFEAFGFNQGWSHYRDFSPVSGASRATPLREAMAWLDNLLKKDKDRKIFLVVHARGGHPPWVGSDDDFKDLPPKEYVGPLTGRRGGQVLAKERNRRYGRAPMTAEDRVRVDAFVRLALRAEDAQLGQLVELLRQHRVWSSTLFMVTSDIAMGGDGRVPFGDGEPMGEDVLEIPLIVRFPGHRFGGSAVHVPTTAMDVARTTLQSLGLEPPEAMEGRDLFEIAAHPGRFAQAPQFSMTGAVYSTRWGNWLLTGVPPRAPKFCEVQPGLECTEDMAARESFFASWMWRLTFDHRQASERVFTPSAIREPATLDPDTVAALTVWGSLEPEPTKR
ncbi:MAG TPA: sulfatase-like hydrolase/transferase [Polyangiaceae bacterium]|nr:sulfatase-like hydrolase/transferase [Polyangiaceae bacterium]